MSTALAVAMLAASAACGGGGEPTVAPGVHVTPLTLAQLNNVITATASQFPEYHEYHREVFNSATPSFFCPTPQMQQVCGPSPADASISYENNDTSPFSTFELRIVAAPDVQQAGRMLDVFDGAVLGFPRVPPAPAATFMVRGFVVPPCFRPNGSCLWHERDVPAAGEDARAFFTVTGGAREGAAVFFRRGSALCLINVFSGKTHDAEELADGLAQALDTQVLRAMQ